MAKSWSIIILAFVALMAAPTARAAAADILTNNPSVDISFTASTPMSSAELQIGLTNGGFEAGDLSGWTTGGTAPWQIDVKSDDFHKAHSGNYWLSTPNLNDQSGASSWLQRDIYAVDTTTLSFWWKVSLSPFNVINFYVDGKIVPLASPQSSFFWEQRTVELAPGAHSIKWEYKRSDSDNFNSGRETALLDDISIDGNYEPVTAPLNLDETSTTATGTYAFVNGFNVYRIAYQDASGTQYFSDQKSVLVDRRAPVITLNGANPLNIPTTTMAYAEPGATAYDLEEGDISGRIVSSMDLDLSHNGTYTVTYSVADWVGNVGMTTRTITVGDYDAPVITLNGSAAVTLERGSAYTDAGATALDNLDGDVTSKIASTTNLDINVTGSYYFAYSAIDAAGNIGHATRTIDVVYTPPVSSGGGSGGGGGGGSLSIVSTPTNAVATTTAISAPVRPAPQVLGIKVYNTSTEDLYPWRANGSIVRTPDGKIYSLDSAHQQKYIKTDKKAKTYGGKKIASITVAELSQYFSWLPYQNGTFLQGPDKHIYIIQNRMKRRISGPSELKQLKPKKIIRVTAKTLALFPNFVVTE